MRTFDPYKVATYEKENWVAYYQKRWLRLLRVSVGMVKETFGLSLWQALYAAYLVARAEIAAAPFPDNDIPRAERYMRRFYGFIKRIHHEDFDVEQAARLEVNWWVIHRQLAGQSATSSVEQPATSSVESTENQPLVEALTDLYAATYGVEAEQVQAAAYHRAQAMLYSDRWVHDGREDDSPLLAQVEEELVKSYSALRTAVAARLQPALAQ